MDCRPLLSVPFAARLRVTFCFLSDICLHSSIAGTGGSKDAVLPSSSAVALFQGDALRPAKGFLQIVVHLRKAWYIKSLVPIVI